MLAYKVGLFFFASSQVPPRNSIDPGAIQFTLIFLLANWRAWVFVYWITAALTAPYGGVRNEEVRPEMEEVWINAPPPAF